MKRWNVERARLVAHPLGGQLRTSHSPPFSVPPVLGAAGSDSHGTATHSYIYIYIDI